MYTSKCKEQETVYTLYEIKLKLKMNSSSKDEVIYLVLKCEHEDLWTIHIHPNCTNDGKYEERSISKEPQTFRP